MKKVFYSLAFFTLLLSSCSNADPKKMASELCDCVKTKKLSAQARKIVLKAARSGDDFKTAVQTEIAAIDDEDKKQSVNEELNDFFLAIQSKKAMACASEIDKKYRVYKTDEKDMQKKMVNEMQDVDGCEAYAAIVKLGLAQKSNTETTTTDDETDQPKKKKTTDDE